MVRLADLPEEERSHLLGKQFGPLGDPVWVAPRKRVKDMRIALITTAGIHLRDDAHFALTDGSYRVIPTDGDMSQLVMSHVSVNFDRTGFAEDLDLVFPLNRLGELAQSGEVGSVAAYHYSFMGGGLTPDKFEAGSMELARHLHADNVDAVLLTPV